MGNNQQRRQEEERRLVQKICDIYDDISRLSSLKPSKEVDMLFSDLVATCIPPSTVDVAKLNEDVRAVRRKLINLCGTAEGLLESHFSSVLCGFDSPLDHLPIFPYHSNYLKLSLLEHSILVKNCPPAAAASRVAFVGSGPLPLTSIVLAKHHMKHAVFHNYDVDPVANSSALRLTSTDPDLSKRMVFHTTNIMDVTTELRDYDVVFLAALVGMGREEKLRVLEHLANNMAAEAVLMLRSAAGARAFLYPVVDPCDLPEVGLEALSVFHPTDEVINSVVIARKLQGVPPVHQHHGNAGGGTDGKDIALPCKWCSKMEGGFNHGRIMEELVLEEQAS